MRLKSNQVPSTSLMYRTKREGPIVPLSPAKGEEGQDKFGGVSDKITDQNTSTRAIAGNQSFMFKSSMPNLMQRIEAQHDAMVTKAKRVLDELSKKYKGTQGRRKIFQEKT